MSECVVRMEMPKKCESCGLRCICKVFNDFFTTKEAGRSRLKVGMEGCLIICQLPEGHGRLVDADAVESIIRKWFEYIKLNPDILLDSVKSLHTIVPAETERSET